MAYEFAEKLRIAIGQILFQGIGAGTCSFGLTEYIEWDTAETLIARSDSGLYRAKNKGRNRVEVAAPISLPTSAAIAFVAYSSQKAVIRVLEALETMMECLTIFFGRQV